MQFSAVGSGAELPRNSNGYVCDLPGINFCFKDECLLWVGVIYYGKMYLLSIVKEGNSYAGQFGGKFLRTYFYP